MTKLWNKLVNTTTEQKIQLTIWIISFVMLIVFVILAAALTKGTESYANTLAATGLVFGLLLVCALLQRLGQALLFPIAMLPVAVIFLILGVAIPGTTGFSEFIGQLFMAIGNAVFGTALPFLFAIGIAFGMTKDKRERLLLLVSL